MNLQLHKDREVGLDLLRIICTLMVILLHQGMNYASTEIRMISEDYFLVGTIYHSFTRTAVPCFVLLSGAFLLQERILQDVGKFYKNSLIKLLVPIFIYGVLYSLLKVVTGFFGGGGYNLKRILWEFVQGVPYYHLWYMFMLIGLYMIAPLLVALKRKTFVGFILLGLCFVFLDVCRIIPRQQYCWIFWGLSYLGYFVFGNIVYEFLKIRFSKIAYKQIIAVFLILSCVCMAIYTYNDAYSIFPVIKKGIITLNLNNWLEYIGALSLFVFFSLFNVNNKIVRDLIVDIAKLCGTVYFVHAGVMTLLNPVAERLVFHNPLPNPVWYIPLMFLIYVMVSFFYAYVINGVRPHKININGI